jgi:hypothetical protein
VTLLASVLVVCFAVSWLALQKTYLKLLPPTQFAFMTQLREPPYAGAPFVVSTYAAPAAVLTGQWAYYATPVRSGATLRLTETGYSASEEEQMQGLWLADKQRNPDYHAPAYFLCFGNQTLAGAAALLRGRTFGECSNDTERVITAAGDLPRGVLRVSAARRDRSGTDRWAILKLDWDFPPYLRAGSSSSARVRVTIDSATRVGGSARLANDRIRLTVLYDYAQQQGYPESRSRVRLYRVGAATPCTAGDEQLSLVQELTDKRVFELPGDFAGRLQVSVIPRTATQAGQEFFSDVVRLEHGVATPCSTRAPGLSGVPPLADGPDAADRREHDADEQSF